MSAEAFKRQLEALSTEYRSSLPEKLEEIDALWRGLPGRETELLRALHSVAGSARTFGVKGVSEAAAAAELYLAPYSERGKAIGAAQYEEFGQLLDALKLAARGGSS
jgi:HPt (histidine-containing phosphotransfer) domain-containing protein